MDFKLKIYTNNKKNLSNFNLNEINNKIFYFN